ncbi:MAG: acetolactate decarboxylase [Synergistaceae bacterium]|nr:acetolactate decarboxylase [Synergistaceae bacterium]MBQ7169867.1 acetolactate decarboxylase [Synergistaceae bacterium]
MRGTIIALYCHDYMNGLNTAGWHLRFISEYWTTGGHVLDAEGKDCIV